MTTHKQLVAASKLISAMKDFAALEAAEAGPSLRFAAAASAPLDGPTGAEVSAAIAKLEQAQAEGDASLLSRAMLGLVQAVTG